MKTSRRNALKTVASAAGVFAVGTKAWAEKTNEEISLRGNINHSVCRWCYQDIPLEELCAAAKDIGIRSVELVGPDEWHVLKKYGLNAHSLGGQVRALSKASIIPLYTPTSYLAMRR